MTVKDIILEYLSRNGYGGLHHDGCGCTDGDLMACGEYCGECEPAYKVLAHCGDCKVEGCDSRGEEGVVWCLTTREPAEKVSSYDVQPLVERCKPCPKCRSTNIKCRGSTWNCEDCGERW